MSSLINPSEQPTRDAAPPPEPSRGAMIDCRNVSFHYPRSEFQLAVNSLQLDRGQSLALIGPSGSGKSTLLELLGGLRTPTAGEVLVDGQPVGALSERKRRRFRLHRIGFVFQNFALFDHLTARENILFPAGAAGMLRRRRDDYEQELTRLAEMTGIGGRQLRQRVATLSRGEQQRVALCRALVHRPRLVLADEPTGNLDPANKQAAMQLLLRVVGEQEGTLVAATHDESLLADFDQVIDVASLGDNS